MSAKKWLLISAAAITAGLAAVAGVLTVLPGDYTVSESVEIDAPVDIIFAQVVDLEKNRAWSPWLARDPDIVNVYSGPAGEVGGSTTWTSDSAGNGSQTVTAIVPNERIDVRVEFEGMDGADAFFLFDPVDADTVRVTWSFSGSMDGLFGGAMAIMIKTFVSADYADGLARLKVVAEAIEPIPEPPPTPVEADTEADSDTEGTAAPTE